MAIDLNSTEHFNTNLRKGFRGSASIYIFLVIKILSGFLISLILVKGLTQEGYGTYKLYESILMLCVGLCSLGMDRSFLRYGAELIIKMNLAAIKKLLFNMLSIRCLIIFIFGFILVKFPYLLQDIFNLPAYSSKLIPLLAILLFFTSVNGLIGSSFLQSRMDHVYDSANKIIARSIKLTGFVCAVWMGMGLEAVLIVWIGSEIFSSLVYVVLNVRWMGLKKKTWGKNLSGMLDNNNFKKRIVQFTSLCYLTSLINIFRNLTVDNLVIAHFLEPKKVAIYALAATLISLATNLNPASLLRGVFQPLFVSRYSQTNNQKDLLIAFRLVLKFVIFTTLPVFICLVILGDKIIAIVFSEKYLQAIVPLNWMCAFFFVSGLSYAFSPLINTLEKNEIFVIGGLFSVYNFIVCILWVRAYGIIGAAFATGTAQILQYIYFWYITKWYVKLNIMFPWRALIKAMINLTPITLFVIYIKKYIINIYILLTVLIVYGLMYLGFAYLNKIFDDKERNVFNNAIGKNLWFF